MSIESRALALFEEANPVPDIEELAVLDVEAAAYLATLADRSSDMTQLDTRPPLETEKKTNPLIWLAAAAAVVILGVVLVFASRSDEPDVVATTVPTTGEATLDGYWQQSGSGAQLRFDGDNYWIVGTDGQVDLGTWDVIVGQIVFRSSDDSDVCAGVDLRKGAYDYSQSDNESLSLQLASEDCDLGRGLGSSAFFERTESFEVPEPGIDMADLTPATAEVLAGTWQSSISSQRQVRFDLDGTYVLDDRGSLETNPRDQGTYEIDGLTITFISGEDSSFCRAGNRAVWEGGMNSTGEIAGAVAADECFGSGNVGLEFTMTRISGDDS